MKEGGGKLKGGQWERDLSRKLSLWISDGKSDSIFWRSAMSGGRATIGLNTGLKRKTQAGDISAIASLGEKLLDHYVIESKFYKDLEITQGIIKDSGLLYQFWDYHKSQAAIFTKFPMMICKQNYVPSLCLMYEESLHQFKLNKDHVLLYLPRWPCIIMLFECFLREAKVPEMALTLVNTRIRL